MGRALDSGRRRGRIGQDGPDGGAQISHSHSSDPCGVLSTAPASLPTMILISRQCADYSTCLQARAAGSVLPSPKESQRVGPLMMMLDQRCLLTLLDKESVQHLSGAVWPATVSCTASSPRIQNGLLRDFLHGSHQSIAKLDHSSVNFVLLHGEYHVPRFSVVFRGRHIGQEGRVG